ncbi:MAG: WG repeat-containing protein, partial [Bacteroidota bacterium]
RLNYNWNLAAREDIGSLRRIKLRSTGQNREIVEAEAVPFGSSDFDEVEMQYRQLNPSDNDFEQNKWFKANRDKKDRYKIFLRPTSAADSAGILSYLQGPFHDLARFSQLSFSLLFPYQKPCQNRLTYLLGANRGKAYAARWLNSTMGTCQETPLLGVRAMDFYRNLPFAAAIDSTGRFVLVDSMGRILQNQETPLQFTYIGEFRNGLARVCVGGELNFFDNQSDNYEERLLRADELRDRFYLAIGQGSYRPYKNLVIQSMPTDSARWGLIDTLGNWVIQPKYQFLEENVEAQMVARKSGKIYGVIDALDQEVVPFQYLRIRPYRGYWRVNAKPFGRVYFNWRGHEMMSAETEAVDAIAEGLFGQRMEGRWRFVNENGHPINGMTYAALRPFGEGLAAVRLDSGAWNFIDSSGQVLQQWEKGKYQDFRSFSEGLCAFRKGARWGFIDQNFKEVLPPIYKKVEPFYLGRAVVTTDQGVGLIDSTGAFIMDPVSFRSISSFNKHGLALASNRRNEHFLVDTSGQVRLPQALQDAELEGTPPYPIQMNGRWGFVDSLGSISIYPAYGEVKRFNSGLAIIRKSVGGPGHWLKQNGQLLNERRYDRIFNFDRGLAVVGKQGHANYLINTKGQKVPLLRGTPLWMDGELIGTKIDGKQFYSDHTGNLAFPQSFDKIHPFNKSETAIVAIKGKKGLIDRRGMLLIQPKYAFLERIPNSDIYEAGPPAFGIYGTNGQLLIPVEFDDIVLLEGDRFRVERGEKVGYLDTEGKVIWPLQN